MTGEQSSSWQSQYQLVHRVSAESRDLGDTTLTAKEKCPDSGEKGDAKGRHGYHSPLEASRKCFNGGWRS